MGSVSPIHSQSSVGQNDSGINFLKHSQFLKISVLNKKKKIVKTTFSLNVVSQFHRMLNKMPQLMFCKENKVKKFSGVFSAFDKMSCSSYSTFFY